MFAVCLNLLQVLDLLIRWTLHNPDKRMAHFERLLQFVKISFCSDSIVTTIGRTKKPEYQNIKKGIIRRLKYLNGIKETKPENLPKIRNSMRLASAFLLGGKDVNRLGSTNRHVHAAQLAPNKKADFKRFAAVPWRDAILRFAASLLPYGIIISGGNQEGLSIDNVYLLDFINRDWNKLPKMLTERDGHISLSYGSSSVIVVCGSRSLTDNTRPGAIQTQALMSVERLDLLDMKWEKLTQVPGQQSTQGAICKDRLYLADTVSPAKTRKRPLTLLEFDLTKGTWQTRRALPNDHSHGRGRLAAILDRLYLIDDPGLQLWKYLVEEDKWERLKSSLLDHHVGGVVYWHGILYCGGENTVDVEEYNVKADEWSEWDNFNAKLQLPAQYKNYLLFAGSHC